MRRLTSLFLLLIGLLFTALPAPSLAETTDLGDPLLKITASQWKSFSVSLGTETTVGYVWRLARPIEGNAVNYLGKDFLPAWGKHEPARDEIWTFDAVEKGQSEIVFEYVRPWQARGVPQAKRLVVRVTVN